MNREEFKNNPEAQKKFYIFAGAVALAILWLLFGGTARTAVRSMTMRRPSPFAARAAVPVPVASVPAVATAPRFDAAALQPSDPYTGHWKGGAMIAKQGLCTLSLEIKQEDGKFLGYPEMTCLATPLLTGRLADKKEAYNPGLMFAKANPAAAILSGSPVDGSLQFHVDKILNTNESGCVMSSFTATNFDSKMSVQWKDSCGGGNMMLIRGR